MKRENNYLVSCYFCKWQSAVILKICFAAAGESHVHVLFDACVTAIIEPIIMQQAIQTCTLFASAIEIQKKQGMKQSSKSGFLKSSL